MNIISKATHAGQTKPFAYEIEDQGETYFVMKESLTNDVILPELLRSGWKLRSLPLGLQKDGMALDDLPETNHVFTDEELMDMQTIEGAPISDTTLRSRYLDRSASEVLPQKPGEYTIHTREELLSYLKLENRNDLRPLNYFTAPSARFSLEEYLSPENSEWLKLMERRRKLSVDEFRALRDWMLSKGLDPNYTFQDFLDFYFSWGICGLTLSFTMQNQIRHYHQKINKRSLDIHHNAYALIDSEGNLYKEPGAQQHEVASPEACESIRRTCDEGELKSVRLHKQVADVISQWDCMELEQPVEFDSKVLHIKDLDLNSIVVTYKNWTMSPELLTMNKQDSLRDDMYLRALAVDLMEKRKVYTNVSSYKALIESGCSPFSALVKLASVYNESLIREGAEQGKETRTIAARRELGCVYVDHIDAFLQDDSSNVPEDIWTFLDDAFTGIYNIDSVADGMRADAAQSATNLYHTFYCAYHIMHIDLDTIYQEVSTFTGERPIVLRAGTNFLRVASSMIKHTLNGYKDDLQRYREDQAKYADDLFWVDMVTREPSSKESERHVGVRSYIVHQTMKTPQDILTKMRKEYADTVNTTVFDEDARDAYLSITCSVAASMLMSCLVRGFWKYPDALGGGMYKPDPEVLKSWRTKGQGSWFIGPKYDDTVTICDTAVRIPADKQLLDVQWDICYTNAVVTPYRVKPRAGMQVRETSLNAVWYDMSDTPNFLEFKRSRAITPYDGIWSVESAIHSWIKTHRGDTISLVDYWERISEIMATQKEFRIVQPPHPLGIGYARFGEDLVLERINPGEPRGFSCGRGYMLTYQQEELTTSKPPIEVYPFNGINSEDFFYTKGTYTLPTISGKVPMLVIDGHIILNKEEIRPADVENMDQSKYPVTHLCGRRYLVRDYRGPVWVVEV